MKFGLPASILRNPQKFATVHKNCGAHCLNPPKSSDFECAINNGGQIYSTGITPQGGDPGPPTYTQTAYSTHTHSYTLVWFGHGMTINMCGLEPNITTDPNAV